MKISLTKILAIGKKAAVVAHKAAPYVAIALALAGKAKASAAVTKVDDAWR